MQYMSPIVLPYKPIKIINNTLIIDVCPTAQLVLFTEDISILPQFNEYILNPERNSGTLISELTNTFNIINGLQNIIKPFIFLYDPVNYGVSYCIFSKKPSELTITRDTNDNIIQLRFSLPSATYACLGYTYLCDFTTDTNSDLIPNFIDKLKLMVGHYRFVEDYVVESWYDQYDLSTTDITTNEFSITLNDVDIVPFVISEGDALLDSNNIALSAIEIITTASGNVILYDVKDIDNVACQNTMTTGSCKIWDTVGQIDESEWIEVTNTAHTFTGDICADNGLVRVKLTATTTSVYVYNNSNWVEIATTNSGISSITSIDNDKVVINNSAGSITIIKGLQWIYTSVKFNLTTTATYYRFVATDNAIFDSALDTETHTVTVDTSSYYGIGISPANDTIPFIVRTTDGAIDAATVVGSGSNSIEINGTSPSRTGIIPFDCSLLYTEAESMGVFGEGVTDYVGVDAYPFTGVTGKVLSNLYGSVAGPVLSTELPEGTYRMYVRCKRDAGTGNDLMLCIRTATMVNATTYHSMTTVPTPVGAFGYAICDFTLTPEIKASTWRTWVGKASATGVDPITVDYVVIVPTTLMEKTAKRTLVDVAPCTKTRIRL